MAKKKLDNNGTRKSSRRKKQKSEADVLLEKFLKVLKSGGCFRKRKFLLDWLSGRVGREPSPVEPSLAPLPVPVVTAADFLERVHRCMGALGLPVACVAPFCVPQVDTHGLFFNFCQGGPENVLRKIGAALDDPNFKLDTFGNNKASIQEILNKKRGVAHLIQRTFAINLNTHLLEGDEKKQKAMRRELRAEVIPCLSGVPDVFVSLYDVYKQFYQYLVIQHGGDGDLGPHIDYLATGVVYYVLTGVKIIRCWDAFSCGRRGDRSNLSILISGMRTGKVQDCSKCFHGPFWELTLRAGDMLFLSPLLIHEVLNQGPSVAYGVNIVAKASIHFIEKVLNDGGLSSYDKYVLTMKSLGREEVQPSKWVGQFSTSKAEDELKKILKQVKKLNLSS